MAGKHFLAKTIMVIDDDAMVIKAIERKFSEVGYDVISAFSAEGGLKRAAEESPQVIILDLVLPDLNGFEVLKRLKEDPFTKDIPVVILTIKCLDEEIRKGLNLGAEDYVAKPVHLPLLIKRVENILKKFY